MDSRIHAVKQFVATQKGQVTVQEDEELILLSDNHWYWWFVRVVATQQVGFVPFEIIELPNERLARQNRQLNIYLAHQTMGYHMPPERKLSQRRVRFNLSSTDLDSGHEDGDREVVDVAILVTVALNNAAKVGIAPNGDTNLNSGIEMGQNGDASGVSDVPELAYTDSSPESSPRAVPQLSEGSSLSFVQDLYNDHNPKKSRICPISKTLS